MIITFAALYILVGFSFALIKTKKLLKKLEGCNDDEVLLAGTIYCFNLVFVGPPYLIINGVLKCFA
jgi:hypothetical protein